MAQEERPKGVVVNPDKLPAQFPTHCHDAVFWESLGRVVATFGFLEEVLGKAIFSFTAMRPYNKEEIDDAFKQWVPDLEKTLTDTLGALINRYEKAVNEHPNANIGDFESLISDLRDLSKYRNAFCHGSWRQPATDGKSTLFFVDRNMDVFDDSINCEFLDQIQQKAKGLSCFVISTVTYMGWQFPGSSGPGKSIYSL